jgi:hypothetical protein
MSTNKKNAFGLTGWTPERLGNLAGKTYVVTGANAGAGLEATRVFLSKGARVGPVGECPLEEHALDRDMAAKLWTLSEQKTSLSWSP